MSDFRYAARAANVIAPAAFAHHRSDMLKLSAGNAYPPALPDLSAEVAEALRRRDETLQYGPLYGIDDLRDAIAAYLHDDGIIADRDNILVVNGAKQGLELACRVFLEPGDAVIVTAPTYLTAVSIFQANEASFVSIAQDADGMLVDELEEKLRTRAAAGLPAPKLLFDTPDFHNPTGITLSATRRRRVLELAAEYDFLVIEDDPYRRVRFEGEALAPVKSLDTEGRVIGLGTTSKILAPGLKIGWVNAAPPVMRRMAAIKADGGSSPFTQRIAAELIRSGRLAEITGNVTRVMHRHRDAMVEAFRRHFPEATFTVPKGGYFLWPELPAAVDSDAFARHAEKFGISVFSGRLSFAENPRTNFLRLSYSYCSPAEIESGVARLAEAFHDLTDSGKMSGRQNGG